MVSKNKLLRCCVAIFIIIVFLVQNTGLAEIIYDRQIYGLKQRVEPNSDSISRHLDGEMDLQAARAQLIVLIRDLRAAGLPRAQAIGALLHRISAFPAVFAATVEEHTEGYCFRIALADGTPYVIGLTDDDREVFEALPKDVGGPKATKDLADTSIRERIRPEDGTVVKLRLSDNTLYIPRFVDDYQGQPDEDFEQRNVIQDRILTPEQIQRARQYLTNADIEPDTVTIGIVLGQSMVNPTGDDRFTAVHAGRRTTTIWFGELLLRDILREDKDPDAQAIFNHDVLHITDPQAAEAEHQTNDYRNDLVPRIQERCQALYERSYDDIIAEVAQPFDNWPSCRRWMMVNHDRLSATRTTPLPYNTIANALWKAGKMKTNWRRYAGSMDLARRLKGFFDRTIEGKLTSWKTTREWLIRHREAAIAANNEELKREAEDAQGVSLSYGTLAHALWEAGKMEEDWSYSASSLDLARRLKGFFDRTIEGKLRSEDQVREWLIKHREAAIAVNNEELKREAEDAQKATLSYGTLAHALWEAGKTEEDWSRVASKMDLARRLKGFFDRTIEGKLTSWKATRERLIRHREAAIAANNEERKKEDENAEETTLSYVTIAFALWEAGKMEEDWRYSASSLDLARRLKGFFDRTIEGKLRSEDQVREWLIKHREAAIAANNEELKREDEDAEEASLSYATLVYALKEADKMEKDWSREGGTLDLAERLSGIMPEGELTDYERTREWLIKNRQAAIAANNAALERESEEAKTSLAYSTIAGVLYERGKIGQRRLWEVTALDYVRNNWGIFYAELMRCSEVSAEPLPTDADELYYRLRAGFNRELLLPNKALRMRDAINGLRTMVEAGTPYNEACRRLGISVSRGRKLRPYVEGKAFTPKPLGRQSFYKYLREFCRTWCDIHNTADPELARAILANIGAPCASAVWALASQGETPLGTMARRLMRDDPFTMDVTTARVSKDVGGPGPDAGSNEEPFVFRSRAYGRIPDLRRVTDAEFKEAFHYIKGIFAQVNDNEGGIIDMRTFDYRPISEAIIPTCLVWNDRKVRLNNNFIRLVACLMKRGLGEVPISHPASDKESNVLDSIIYSIALHEIRGHFRTDDVSGAIQFVEDERIAQMERGINYRGINLTALFYYWFAFLEGAHGDALEERLREFMASPTFREHYPEEVVASADVEALVANVMSVDAAVQEAGVLRGFAYRDPFFGRHIDDPRAEVEKQVQIAKQLTRIRIPEPLIATGNEGISGPTASSDLAEGATVLAASESGGDFGADMLDALKAMFRVAGAEVFARRLEDGTVNLRLGRPEVRGKEMGAVNAPTRETSRKRRNRVYNLVYNIKYMRGFEGYLRVAETRRGPKAQVGASRDHLLKTARNMGHELGETLAKDYLAERYGPYSTTDPRIEAAGILSEIILYHRLYNAFSAGDDPWHDLDLADDFNEYMRNVSPKLKRIRMAMRELGAAHIAEMLEDSRNIRSDSQLGALLKRRFAEFAALDERGFADLRNILDPLINPAAQAPTRAELGLDAKALTLARVRAAPTAQARTAREAEEATPSSDLELERAGESAERFGRWTRAQFEEFVHVLSSMGGIPHGYRIRVISDPSAHFLIRQVRDEETYVINVGYGRYSPETLVRAAPHLGAHEAEHIHIGADPDHYGLYIHSMVDQLRDEELVRYAEEVIARARAGANPESRTAEVYPAFAREGYEYARSHSHEFQPAYFMMMAVVTRRFSELPGMRPADAAQLRNVADGYGSLAHERDALRSDVIISTLDRVYSDSYVAAMDSGTASTDYADGGGLPPESIFLSFSAARARRDGDHEKAEELIKKSLRLNNRDERSWTECAMLYLETGRFAEAHQCIRRALDIAPGEEGARTAQANIFLAEGKPAEAVRVLEALVAEKPHNGGYRRFLTRARDALRRKSSDESPTASSDFEEGRTDEVGSGFAGYLVLKDGRRINIYTSPNTIMPTVIDVEFYIEQAYMGKICIDKSSSSKLRIVDFNVKHGLRGGKLSYAMLDALFLGLEDGSLIPGYALGDGIILDTNTVPNPIAAKVYKAYGFTRKHYPSEPIREAGVAHVILGKKTSESDTPVPVYIADEGRRAAFSEIVHARPIDYGVFDVVDDPIEGTPIDIFVEYELTDTKNPHLVARLKGDLYDDKYFAKPTPPETASGEIGEGQATDEEPTASSDYEPLDMDRWASPAEYRAELAAAVEENSVAVNAAFVPRLAVHPEDRPDEPVCFEYYYPLKDLLWRDHRIIASVKVAYFKIRGRVYAHNWVETEHGWKIDPYVKGHPFMEGEEVLIMGPDDAERVYYPDTVTTNIDIGAPDEVQQQDTITVQIPPQLQALTDNKDEIKLASGNVADVIDRLIDRFPGIQDAIMREGQLADDRFILDVDKMTERHSINSFLSVHSELCIVPVMRSELIVEVARFVQRLRRRLDDAASRGEELVVVMDTDLGNMGYYAEDLLEALNELAGSRGFENLTIITGSCSDAEFIRQVNERMAGIREKKKVRAVAIARATNVANAEFSNLDTGFQVASVDDSEVMRGDELLYRIELSELTSIIEEALATDRRLIQRVLHAPVEAVELEGEEIRRRYEETARYLRSA